MAIEVDILEDYICQISPDLLVTLLKDHTMSQGKDSQCNIFWATSDYQHLGSEYSYYSPILPHLITGVNGHVVMPRVLKSRDTQSARSRDMAEVFTPSWVCNAQNNLIDEAWFGRKDVFNTEYVDERGVHQWKSNSEKIIFPNNKTWRDYVRDIRLEITCGEAPYLVSRYDTTTGELIPLENRIGLLDRKLRVVSENATTSGEWLDWAQVAYKSIYGYEWQGDNLLLAREALLITFIEYYEHKFGKLPLLKSINYIAYIISWNVWQMDGLKMVIPGSCERNALPITDLFGEVLEQAECPACKSGEMYGHIGTKCLIRDWRIKDREKQKIPFVQLIRK